MSDDVIQISDRASIHEKIGNIQIGHKGHVAVQVAQLCSAVDGALC